MQTLRITWKILILELGSRHPMGEKKLWSRKLGETERVPWFSSSMKHKNYATRLFTAIAEDGYVTGAQISVSS